MLQQCVVLCCVLPFLSLEVLFEFLSLEKVKEETGKLLP